MIHAASDRVSAVRIFASVPDPHLVAFGEARHRACASAGGPSPKAPAVAGCKPTSCDV